MSIKSVTRSHTVTVLNETATVGASGGVKRDYSDGITPRIIECTVQPGFQGNPMEMVMLDQNQVKMPHTLYFSEDPNLNETHRLVWNQSGTKLRVVAVPKNTAGKNRLYKVWADAWTIDNVGRTIE